MMRRAGLLTLLLSFAALANVQGVEASDKYQLIANIVCEEEEVRQAFAVVFLQATRTPFVAQSTADLTGKFKFKNLHSDLYTLTVHIPRAGEHRQTVEIGPGKADSRKRVFVDIRFRSNLGSKYLSEVSSVQLSVSEKARKEFEKAQKRLGKRDREGALKHLERSVSLSPQFVEAWNMLGTMAYQSADFTLAERHFREALKHDPECYAPLVNLGGALLSQGRWHDSLPLNIAAVSKRPDDALAHSQLGLNYYYLQDFTSAEQHLRRSIELDPAHFSYPQLPLSEIYLRRKDFKSALRELEAFVSLHPDAGETSEIRRTIREIHLALTAPEQ